MSRFRSRRTQPNAATARFGLLAALGLLAAGLALSACGGSSTPSDPAASAADSALKFSQCMREHGVKDFPNPETTAGGATRLAFKGEGGSPATMEAAQKACQHFQEEGGEGPELTPQEKVEHEEAVQKFAKCMREHGIKVEASGGGVQVKIGLGPGGPGAGKPKPSPALQAAQEACQGLLPFKGGPGGPGAVRAAPGGGSFGTQTHVGG
jgi:predicted lipoprotein